MSNMNSSFTTSTAADAAVFFYFWSSILSKRGIEV